MLCLFHVKLAKWHNVVVVLLGVEKPMPAVLHARLVRRGRYRQPHVLCVDVTGRVSEVPEAETGLFQLSPVRKYNHVVLQK